MVKQMVPLVLLGGSIERSVGPVAWLGAFALTGAGGCVASWLLLRRRLLRDPEYARWDRSDVTAIADATESRGASSAVYGAAAFGAVVAGPRSCFGPWLAAFVAPLLPELCRWDRQKKRPVRIRAEWWALMVFTNGSAALVASSLLGGDGPTVAVFVCWWFSFNMFRKVVDLYMDVAPRGGVAAADWESHLCGAFLGLVAGWGLGYPVSDAWALTAVAVVVMSALKDR